MNQFVVLDDGRRETSRGNPGEHRGTLGAAAMFVFSPDFTEVITLYGSRFKNRKVPSGGIEEGDARYSDVSVVDAAWRAALRELAEETGVTQSQLLSVDRSNVVDTIRGDMQRHYFVAVARERFDIKPFRSQEEGKEHYVDHQAWDSVENILRGATHSGDSYNTLYSIALVRILQEMQAQGFNAIEEFEDLIIDLAFRGITLDEQLEMLEKRKDVEELERSRKRRQY